MIIEVECPESKAYCPACGRELKIFSFTYCNTGKDKITDIHYQPCICQIIKNTTSQSS